MDYSPVWFITDNILSLSASPASRYGAIRVAGAIGGLDPVSLLVSLCADAVIRRQLAMLSFGFPPVSSPAARVLVLGSLPGRVSLERGEYYANPQNAFWKIVAARVPDLPTDYAGRAAALIEQGVALWDVLAAATRSGSLDADIADDAIPNNFHAFFHTHPHIRLIAFNGATAAKLYERHVIPTLHDAQHSIARETLPSTSGAHASLAFSQKVARWSVLWGDVVDN
jgi:double-stranded uracil-DNA glycosylase